MEYKIIIKSIYKYNENVQDYIYEKYKAQWRGGLINEKYFFMEFSENKVIYYLISIDNEITYEINFDDIYDHLKKKIIDFEQIIREEKLKRILDND